MEYENDKKSTIIGYLEGLHTDDLISLYNEYADDIGDERIYDNDEETLNELFNNNAMSAIRAVCFGDYQYNDDYVRFNGYGNLESLNEYNVADHIDFDDLADWIMENTPQEIVESLEEILPDVFKSLLESEDNVSADDEDIVDSVISDHDIIDDNWDNIADEVKKEIERYHNENDKQ